MQEGYFKTSWSDIKNSPGWFSKLCLMGLLLCIPVFGPIVVYGYAFGWARDIAWDVHRPMPEKIFGNEDGQLYSRGFYAWLIMLIVSIIVAVISAFDPDNDVVALIAGIVQIALSMVALVCIMRAAIYGRLGAGFQLGRVWAMIRHDTNGLLRILGMILLVGLIVGAVWGVVFTIVIVAVVLAGVGVAGLATDWDALGSAFMYGTPGAEQQIMSILGTLAPVIGIALVLGLLLVYVLMVFSAWMTLLQARAMGYWTRGFDVAHWGGQDDPMPFELQKAAAAQQAAAQYAAYYQQQAAQQAAGQAPQAQPVAGDAWSQASAASNDAANPYAGQNPYAVQSPYEAPAPTATAPQPTVTQAASVAQPVAFEAAAGEPTPAVPNASAAVIAPQVASAQEGRATQEAPAVVAGEETAFQAAPFMQDSPTDQPAAPLEPEPLPLQQEPAGDLVAEAQALVDDAFSIDGAEQAPVAEAASQILAADADAPESESLYAGSPVQVPQKQEVPLAPRWQKLDLDALDDKVDATDGGDEAGAVTEE